MPTAAPETAPITPFALSQEELERFERDGFLGPYAICSPEEMAQIRRDIETRVLASESPFKSHNGQSRHLDCKVVYDLCAHPAVTERMAGIVGPDLVLWRSNFFVKEAGGKEIPWHQDRAYWPLDPAINITAWIAIDPCTRENSCVEILPGSHKKNLPTVKSGDRMAFKMMADTHGIDLDKKVEMALKPGEFFLFNETTLHHSEPNRSDKRRIGLAVRVTVPAVKVKHEEIFPGHRCVLIRGCDTHHRNEMQAPPAGNPPVQEIDYRQAKKPAAV